MKTKRKTVTREEVLGIPKSFQWPDKFDKTLAKLAIKMIRGGSTPRAACIANGIEKAKYDEWMKRGREMARRVLEEGIEPHNMPDKDMIVHAFYTDITRALAHAAQVCSQRIAGAKDWRAQAWRMEKIYSRLLEDPEAPLAPVGPDGKPVPQNGGVVIYVPDNGRSTR